jgi:hypothetical protein
MFSSANYLKFAFPPDIYLLSNPFIERYFPEHTGGPDINKPAKMLIRTTAGEDTRKITRYVISQLCNCKTQYSYREPEFSNAYSRPTAQPMVTAQHTHSRMVPPTLSMVLLLGLTSAESLTPCQPWILDTTITFTFKHKSIHASAAEFCMFYIVT